jgi:hypothetical protein
MADVLRRHAAWLDAWAPVIVVLLLGGTWIATHASAGRGQVHTAFQVLALAEAALSVRWRRRKPALALAAVGVVYLLADLDAILFLPLLIALATVAMLRPRRMVVLACAAVAATVAVMPLLHGDRGASSVTGPGLHLAAVGLAVLAGAWLRARGLAAAPGTGRGVSGPVEPGEHVQDDLLR